MLKILLIGLISIGFSQDISKNLESFTKLKIKVSSETTIEFGDEYKIEITGKERSIKNIRFDIYGTTLVIEDKNRSFFSWNDRDDRIKIKIVTKSLEAAIINGSGNVYIEPLKNSKFDLEISGSADVEMSGKAKDLIVSINGSGDLRFTDLEADILNFSIRGSGDIVADGMAKEADIDVRGSGDVKAGKLEVNRLEASIHGSGNINIHVNDEIRASIYGSGDIRFSGKAKIVRERINGSGDLERE